MTRTKLLKHGVESVGKTFWIDRRQWPFHRSHGGGSREYVERGCISSYPVNRSDQGIRFVQVLVTDVGTEGRSGTRILAGTLT
jgi:hypothetical protein